MAENTRKPARKRVDVRYDPQLLERIDAWRRRQKEIPSFAEAVRTLLNYGLDAQLTGNGADK